MKCLAITTPALRTAFAAAALLSQPAPADFKVLTANAYTTTAAGVDYAVLDVYASFDDPLDELLDVLDVEIKLDGGATFNHDDGGGTSWSPNWFIPALGIGDPIVDSFVTIGGQVGDLFTFSNTTQFDPGFSATSTSVMGGWFNGSPPNMQGQAVQLNPNGAPCLHHVWIGRFVVRNAGVSGIRLVLTQGTIGWTNPNGPSVSQAVVPQAWEFGVNPPTPAAPTGAATAKVFRVQGIANNLDWSWEISGMGMATLSQPYVKGVVSGDLGFFDVRDATHRFADSINALAAELCLTPGQLSASADPLLLSPGAAYAGCSPNGADDALLTINVGSPTWDLAVGAAWMAPNCLVGLCDIGVCGFNPLIAEIPLSGLDCNGNGEDDALDILRGTSADNDVNGIPDECAGCPASDHPCESVGDPGCTDLACCGAVCAFDPFCCKVAWDQACVESASLLCVSPPVPVNDECTGAIAITGTGVFDFDLTGATTSAVGPGCWSSTEAMESDVWFKWTCTCAGARFTTCGLSDLDTVIEIYPAWTGCPSDADDAICCNDDAIPLGSCGVQSDIPFCDTRCGEEYYIRIGVYPGTPAGSGEFAIVCEPPAFFCCGSPTAGSCFAAHASAACNDVDCCWAVCTLQPHCCQTEWDVACVKAAIEAAACAWPIACPPIFPGPRVFVCRAGCVDDFALPPDPVQSANASCVPFDVVSVDSCVSHTFQSCWASDPACGECGPVKQAWLEIRYKVGPQGFPDLQDTISFLDQGTLIAGTPAVAVAFDTPVTSIIDLSAVPGLFGGTTDILWSLVDSELGVLCGDDVTVDYATLTVIKCPCAMWMESGIARDELCDGGTSVSVGKPSKALTDFLCPLPPGLGCLNPTSQYDYQVAGTTVYDTLAPVPDCLNDATVFLNVQFPGGSSGVMVHLELDRSCGTKFAWSMSIDDLMTLTGYPPPAYDYLLPNYYCEGWSLMRLPLDALPTDLLGNTTTLLSQTLDNRIDYAIGPGAIVDWAFVNYIYCCPFDPDGEDLDGDGVVGGGDLGVLLSQWGPCDCECCDADLDLDGVVNGADVGLLLAGWGG